MTHGPVLASGANATAITISVGIIFIIGAVIAVVVWSYFRLQSVAFTASVTAAFFMITLAWPPRC